LGFGSTPVRRGLGIFLLALGLLAACEEPQAPTFSCYSRVGGWQEHCLRSRLQKELGLDSRTAQELSRRDPEEAADLLLMLDYGRAVDGFLNRDRWVNPVPPDPQTARELERIRRNRGLLRDLRWALRGAEQALGPYSPLDLSLLKPFLDAMDRFERMRRLDVAVRSIATSREAYTLLDLYFRKRYGSEAKPGCGEEIRSPEEAWESLRWDEDIVYRTVVGPVEAMRRGWEREGGGGEEDLHAWAEFALQAYRMTACPESEQIREELGRGLQAALSGERR